MVRSNGRGTLGRWTKAYGEPGETSQSTGEAGKDGAIHEYWMGRLPNHPVLGSDGRNIQPSLQDVCCCTLKHVPTFPNSAVQGPFSALWACGETRGENEFDRRGKVNCNLLLSVGE